MTIIELVRTSDPYTKLSPGARGRLISRYRDPWSGSSIDVAWEDGSTLSLIAGEDEWLEIDEVEPM
jgi:hypothetical protein